MDRYLNRRQKLLGTLKPTGASCLLVSQPQNVRYLTGFSGEDSLLLLSKQRTLMLSDSRFTTQLAEECPALECEIRTAKSTLAGLLAKVLPLFGVTAVGFEAAHVTVAQQSSWFGGLPGITSVATTGLVEKLRSIKDADEIRNIREAVRQAELGFCALKARLLPQMSELAAAHDLEHSMRRFGASKAAFDPIVAVGSRGALPHARASCKLLSESSLLLVDWGARTLEGYCSDLTRILVAGTLPGKISKVYEVVLAAQIAGIAAIRPGVSGREVDAAARAVIAEAGFAKYFGHGLGHGIGLDVHESVRLSPLSEELLEPGMVVTVEPGIYLPGVGGIRIEDDVLVTRDGYEVLSSLPKTLEESRWNN